MKAVWEWFCNAVNGNLSTVPSPVAWGLIAAVYGKVVIREVHAKLDHIIEHHPAIPAFHKSSVKKP